MKTLRWLWMATFVFLAITSVNAQPPPGGGRGKLQHFQELLAQAKAAGIDTTQAEELNRQSREAIRGGDRLRADRLMDQAIAELSSRGGTGASRGVQTPPREPRPVPVARTAPTGGSSPVFFMAFTHHYNGPGHASVRPDGQAVAYTRSRDGRLVVSEKNAEGWGGAGGAAALDRSAGLYSL